MILITDREIIVAVDPLDPNVAAWATTRWELDVPGFQDRFVIERATLGTDDVFHLLLEHRRTRRFVFQGRFDTVAEAKAAASDLLRGRAA